MYDIVYCGSIQSDLEVAEEQVMKFNSNYGKLIDENFPESQIVFSIGIKSRNPDLFIFHRSSNSELKIREVIQKFVQDFPGSYGSVLCYGECFGDIRRFFVRDDRVYEQMAEVEFADPGLMIYMREQS